MSSPINTPLDSNQQAQMWSELQNARSSLQQNQLTMEQMNKELQHLRAAQLSAAASSPSRNQDPLRNTMKVTPLNPSSFTGQTGNNANQWLIEMERYFAVTGISHAQNGVAAVRFASTYLKGPASVWYTSNYPDLAREPATWEIFKDAFLTRFRPFAAERLARHQLRELRQTRGVAEYSDLFLRTVQHIPTMHTSDQIDAYLHGLKAHISAEVDRCEPKTLSAAIEIAQKEESRQYPAKGQRLPFYSNHQRRNIVPYPSSNSAPRAPVVDPNSMDINNIFGSSNPSPPYDFQPAFPTPVQALPNYSQFLNAIGANPNNSQPDQEAQLQQRYNDFVVNWQQLSAMYQRPSAGYRQHAPNPRHRAPSMSQDEYRRCVANGLCLICKKKGHIARDCEQAKPLN